MTTTTLAPLPAATRLGRVDTIPNLVTLVRTALAVAIGAYGVAAGEPSALLVAYAAYWVGDLADGWLARRLDQETRLGAVLDIVCDRACTVLLCAGLVAHTPAVAPVAVVFLLSFAVLDTMLSLAFLCWPIDTPNHFWRVDRRVYELNWSPLGKAVNTAGVIGAVAVGAHAVALLVALAVLAVKVWSAARVLRLLS
ncbi:CDP-alcohol phosphatidyltransferase family protein [Nocardioides sp. W7]|uniref:CDP-alcohol phosphatidyltransferase family protein n=1 Tax=Nocardioides sp. W7 TaxID=2931390 RepID=UPI001FD2C04E|nr:CDP-alcohol phosphatidyltransferase family protein [Nocardioides sp. W7]